MMNEIRLDANETAYLNRQLEHLKAQTYDVEYARLSALEVFSIDATTPQYAETVTYQQFDSKGQAELISDYGNLPTIEVGMKPFTTNVKDLGLSASYTIKDIKRGAIQGTPLPSRKMLAIREGIMQLHNRLFWLGDSGAGITGVLSQANVPNAVVATGTGGTTWATKTASEMYADLTGAVIDMITLTKGVEVPNFIVMTSAKLESLRTKRLGDNTGDTVLEAFQKQYPNITFYTEELFETAFTGGANGFLLGNNNPIKIELQAPIVIEIQAPQQQGLAFSVPAIASNGGCTMYKPYAFSKKYGI